MATSNLSKSILGALNMIGADTTVDSDKAKAVIPTAKTRTALEKLCSSSAEELAESGTNLRELLADLFNWDGKNKVNKGLIREFNTAINTEGKYAHAVELTGFLVALAPMLEPDRIARIYSAVSECESVYSPIKYTLQLSASMKKVFSQFSEERIERLAKSFWVDTHKGNWWSITLGKAEEEIAEPENEAQWTPSEAIEALKQEELNWSKSAAEALKKSKKDEELTLMFRAYKAGLNRGEILPAEPAILSSFIPWLEIKDRPESPIFSILNILQPIMESKAYTIPKRPREFRELFPPISEQILYSFPIPVELATMNESNLIGGAEVVFIEDAQQLAGNAQYMGNCTLSYRNDMENGKYALFRINYGGTAYNAAIVKKARAGWSLGEVNSRHNRGNVPPELKESLQKFVRELETDENSHIITRGTISEYSGKKLKLI